MYDMEPNWVTFCISHTTTSYDAEKILQELQSWYSDKVIRLHNLNREKYVERNGDAVFMVSHNLPTADWSYLLLDLSTIFYDKNISLKVKL